MNAGADALTHWVDIAAKGVCIATALWLLMEFTRWK